MPVSVPTLAGMVACRICNAPPWIELGVVTTPIHTRLEARTPERHAPKAGREVGATAGSGAAVALAGAMPALAGSTPPVSLPT
jgi:hypothetical protein